MDNGDAYYQAMLARDHRFDGKFFVGVKTTGVYCRPICPARPKRGNVEFFSTGHAAEKAGYRPCLRCRPEAAPLSAAWAGKSALVQRALRLLRDTQALTDDEDAFAERFGVTARHLRRLFIAEIGKTPKRIAFENRLNLSRKLIYETALPIAAIGFAAGFASIRRFNAAFLERFKKTPSGIRRGRAEAASPMILSLPYRPPFDFDGLLAFYSRHAISGLETFGPGRYARVVSFAGKSGRIAVTNDPSGNRLLVEYGFPDPAAIGVILNRVREMFDLDSDPLLIANAMRRDRRFAAFLAKRPGARLPTGWDRFETAIATILGQLVSVSQGRRLVDDVVRLYGAPTGLEANGEPILAFPSPEILARADFAGLGTTGKRKAALAAFAKEVASGRLSLEPAQDMEAFRAALLAISGIGRWTADYMALRVLGHADAFPATDLVLARALAEHGPEAIAKLSPWRGYAAILLWGEYAHAGRAVESATQTLRNQEIPMNVTTPSIQYALKTWIGSLYLIASDQGLRGVYWQKRDVALTDDIRGKAPRFAVLRKAARQIGEYLDGRRRDFDLDLDFSGTAFQESVWKALRGIPYGETISYRQLAAKIRNPKAVRAVGSANGKNPLCILIPCHRVIAADGSIGGYAGGVANKEKLLALEKA